MKIKNLLCMLFVTVCAPAQFTYCNDTQSPENTFVNLDPRNPDSPLLIPSDVQIPHASSADQKNDAVQAPSNLQEYIESRQKNAPSNLTMLKKETDIIFYATIVPFIQSNYENAWAIVHNIHNDNPEEPTSKKYIKAWRLVTKAHNTVSEVTTTAYNRVFGTAIYTIADATTIERELAASGFTNIELRKTIAHNMAGAQLHEQAIQNSLLSLLAPQPISAKDTLQQRQQAAHEVLRQHINAKTIRAILIRTSPKTEYVAKQIPQQHNCTPFSTKP